jgi:hypothetical protein
MCILCDTPSNRIENGLYLPWGDTVPSYITPHCLKSKLAFQCRCARVSQKLKYLILYSVKNTFSCYPLTRIWTSLLTMWKVRNGIQMCLYYLLDSTSLVSYVFSFIAEPLVIQFQSVLEQSFPTLGIFLLFGAASQLGPRPLHAWGFEITLNTHHTRYVYSGRGIGSSRRPLPDNARHSQHTDIHAPAGFKYAIPASKRR